MWWSKQQAKKLWFSTMLFRRLERTSVAGSQAPAIAVKEGWWHQGPVLRFSLCGMTDKETLGFRENAGESPRTGKQPGCWSPARQLNQRWTACYFNSPLWGPPQTICASGYTSNIYFLCFISCVPTRSWAAAALVAHSMCSLRTELNRVRDPSPQVQLFPKIWQHTEQEVW